MAIERLDELAPSLYLSAPDGKFAVFSSESLGTFRAAQVRAENGFGMLGAEPKYRYLLGRTLRDVTKQRDIRIGFVMLNPSTASHEEDDPTIRKCVGFARRWGAAEILVANCYAFRATDPDALKHAVDPVGELNEAALQSVAKHCTFVVCAWGRHARERGVQTGKLLAGVGADLRCLALNRDGSPKHPLYVPYPEPSAFGLAKMPMTYDWRAADI